MQISSKDTMNIEDTLDYVHNNISPLSFITNNEHFDLIKINIINFSKAERCEYHQKSWVLNPNIAYNPPERVLFEYLKYKKNDNC